MFFFTALKEILGSKNFLSSISEETTNGNDQDFNTCRVKRIWGSKTIVIKWVLGPNFVKCKQCQLVYKFKKKILSIGNQVSYFSFTVLFWNYWRTVIGKCNPNHLNKKETKNFRQLTENYGDKEGQITDGPLIFYSLFPSGTLLFLFFSTVFVMKPSVAYPRYCIERSQTVAAITEQSSSWFQLGFRIVASSVLRSS